MLRRLFVVEFIIIIAVFYSKVLIEVIGFLNKTILALEETIMIKINTDIITTDLVPRRLLYYRVSDLKTLKLEPNNS